jgi:LacI family transcriptional regulator
MPADVKQTSGDRALCPNAAAAPRRATQGDIARLAHVSQAAVSIVLRNPETTSIPAATRKRIKAAARKLGYVPNRAAQALVNARTAMIACVVPDITNPFYPGFVRAVQRAVNASGYDVTIIDTDGTREGELRALSWLQQGRADGLAGTFFHLGLAELGQMARHGTAIARIQSRVQRGGSIPVDTICIDNAGAGAGATKYLIERGHRAIAIIAGRGGPGQERVRGYVEAMIAGGLQPDIVWDEEFSVDGGRRCAAEILARRRRPTAIFAANDLLAIGVLTALREAGVVVPRDIALVGYDDIPAAALVSPALTTMRQDWSAIGAAAAALLLDRLGQGAATSGRAVSLPFRIILRDSA